MKMIHICRVAGHSERAHPPLQRNSDHPSDIFAKMDFIISSAEQAVKTKN
jgi:hypothetical protein